MADKRAIDIVDENESGSAIEKVGLTVENNSALNISVQYENEDPKNDS